MGLGDSPLERSLVRQWITFQFGCLDLADKKIVASPEKCGQLFGEQHLPCWRAEDCGRHTSVPWNSWCCVKTGLPREREMHSSEQVVQIFTARSQVKKRKKYRGLQQNEALLASISIFFSRK